MTDVVDNKIRAAVQSVEPSPEFSESLWKRIDHSARPLPAQRTFKRWLWAPAVMGMLTLIFFLAAPQTAMAAMRNLIVYLPGIGFVQDEQGTLYLQKPLTFEQEGFSLIIEQVVADMDKTVVSYHIEGIPDDQTSVCFYSGNRLLMADGAAFLPIGGGVSGNQARVEFAPLPENVSGATLLASMNPNPDCTAPEEWRVEFSLGPEAPETEFLPVVENPELGSALEEVISNDENAASPSIESSMVEPQFIVEKTVILQDGYLLHGRIFWNNEDWQGVAVDRGEMGTMYAVDADGKHVPVDLADESVSGDEFAFVVADKDFVAPLTFYIERLWIMSHSENPVGFSFDAGPDPYVGQHWDLDEVLEVAGQRVTIHNASVVQNEEQNMLGYAFEVSTENEGHVMIWCVEDEGKIVNHAGDSRPLDNGHQLVGMYSSEGLPRNDVSCSVSDFDFLLSGSWQFEWQPPDVGQ